MNDSGMGNGDDKYSKPNRDVVQRLDFMFPKVDKEFTVQTRGGGIVSRRAGTYRRSASDDVAQVGALDKGNARRAGQPAFCICDVADELNADLIMMGCRGIGLSSEHSDESVSNRVINLSPCPVMVIP